MDPAETISIVCIIANVENIASSAHRPVFIERTAFLNKNPVTRTRGHVFHHCSPYYWREKAQESKKLELFEVWLYSSRGAFAL